MKKKKKIIITLLVTGIVILIGGAVLYHIRWEKPRITSNPGVVISGNPVNNEHNNRLFYPQLVRIDEKLYYSYFKDQYNYGIYEIDSECVKELPWKGPRILDAQFYVPFLRSFDSELLMYDREKKVMYEYSESGSKQESTFFKDGSTDNYANESFQETNYGVIYEKRDRVSSCYALALKNENGEKIIVEPKDGSDIHSFYYSNDKLYYELWYQNPDPQLCKNHIRVYDLQDKTDTMVYDFGSELCIGFAIESNYLVFHAKKANSVCVVDLCKPEKRVEKIRDLSDPESFNVFAGKVYVCSSTGVYSYDLLSKELSILCDQESKWCYIVDDYWAYFVDDDSNLYRVAQKGSEVETVFSPSTLERIFGPQ